MNLTDIISTVRELHERSNRSAYGHAPSVTAESWTLCIRQELQEVLDAQTHSDAEAEVGDLLLNVLRFARYLGVDAMRGAEASAAKVNRRFNYIDRHIETGLTERERHLAARRLWNECKEGE